MEMCYDGTLVMPSSYAIMNEDEMAYVEGGSVTINITRALIIAAVGKIVISASKSVAAKLIRAAVPRIAAYVISCVNPIVSAALVCLGGFFMAALIAATTVISYVAITGKSIKLKIG